MNNTKKIFAVILSLMITISCFGTGGITASAEATSSGTCGDNLTWTLDTYGTLTISGTGDMADYTVNTYTSSNYAPWHESAFSVKNAVIEDGVTSIGDCAFLECSNLKSITISDDVKKIGESAFRGCNTLNGVTIPAGVTQIGVYAFAFCTDLTEISIPAGVTSIGSMAFSSCTGLESIKVESGNEVYDSRGNCNAIIETGTDTLVCGCKNMVIPEDIVSIGDGAFYGSAVTEITIPGNVKSIEASAFQNCTGLTGIAIPESVTDIGDWAFFGCTALTDISIGNSVTGIGQDAFTDTGYYNNEDNREGDVLYIGCYLVNANNSVSGEYTVKSSTKVIADHAFYNCSELTGITITDGVVTIGSEAFSSCEKLSDVVIPSGVKVIKNSAFDNCTSLSSMTIPDGVTEISDDTFYGCTGLKEITIPASVKNIGDNAFGGCSSLSDVNYAGTEEQWKAVAIGTGNNISDEIVHWHLHSYTSETARNATCTEDGEATYTCSCGDSYTETIPCLGHDYEVAVNPTCTTEGLRRCSRCSEYISIPALGHSMTETPATCTADGYNTCSRCGYIETTDEALGHNYEVVINPTCTESGLSICSDCGETISISSLGHYYEDVVINPTCTTEGLRRCSRCSEYISIPSIGHCYGEPVVKDGVEVRTCKNCKSVIQHSTGSDTDITVTYDNGTFSSDNVSLSVEKHEDPGSVDNHDFIAKIGKTAIVSYDIHMKNGEQPKDGKKVIVSIPVPEGITDCSSLYIFHYKDESYYEKIRCFGSEGDENKFTVENIAGHDYLIFEVSSFSEFAICLETSVSDAVINVASAKTVEYKSKVSTITATASNVPEGYHLAMYVNGAKVADGDNTSVTYNMNKQITSDISYTVKVVDTSGTVQKDADGNNLTKESKITCNASFFAKIIAFFKGIFGLLPTTEVKP